MAMDPGSRHQHFRVGSNRVACTPEVIKRRRKFVGRPRRRCSNLRTIVAPVSVPNRTMIAPHSMPVSNEEAAPAIASGR